MLAAIALSPAAGSVGTTGDELVVEFALVDLLYSPALAKSMAKCVYSTEAKWSSEIRGRVREAATLPTKSRQQEVVGQLVEAQLLVPFRARADCMTTGLMYLEYANTAVSKQTSSGDMWGSTIVPKELIGTALDLSESGQSDLAFLLESFSSGTVINCGPWVTGKEFRNHVPNGQGCGAWSHADEAQDATQFLMQFLMQNIVTGMKQKNVPAVFKGRSDRFFTTLQQCYHDDWIKSASGGDAEERWKASCRLAELTGLSTSNVRTPDFLKLRFAAEVGAGTKETSPAPVRVPPSSQGKGAKITQPEYSPASRRAGEAGTVLLDLLVLESGKVGDVKVRKSSGFPRLDEAAVREAQIYWRLVPGTEDGKPVAMWHTLVITSRLTD